MNSSITGYSDKISVAGGETIAFKVSARPPGRMRRGSCASSTAT